MIEQDLLDLRNGLFKESGKVRVARGYRTSVTWKLIVHGG